MWIVSWSAGIVFAVLGATLLLVLWEHDDS